jgi:hypothetical protein
VGERGNEKGPAVLSDPPAPCLVTAR